MMAEIEPGFRPALRCSHPLERQQQPHRGLNTTGAMHDGDLEGLIDRPTRRSPVVRWVDNMQTLSALAPSRIIEISPGRPLRGFFRGWGRAG